MSINLLVIVTPDDGHLNRSVDWEQRMTARGASDQT